MDAVRTERPWTLSVPRLTACSDCRGSGSRDPGQGEKQPVLPVPGRDGAHQARPAGRHAIRDGLPARVEAAGTMSGPNPAARAAGDGACPNARKRSRCAFPPAIDDGATLRISGKGDCGARAGGPPGNLLLHGSRIASRPEKFRRDGSVTLVCEVPVGSRPRRDARRNGRACRP